MPTKKSQSPQSYKKDSETVIPVAKDQCQYVNPDNNNRCRNKLGLYSRYCALHTNIIENIQIKKSMIPKSGNGLFAGDRGFKKGQVIARYGYPWNYVKFGDLERKCKNKDSHKCFEYVFCDEEAKNPKNTRCWDGANKRSTIARYANDCHGTNVKCNAYFEMRDGIPYIVAGKPIAPNTEIYCNYGDEYWS